MRLPTGARSRFNYADYWQFPSWQTMLRMQLGHLRRVVTAQRLPPGWRPLYVLATPRSGSTWLTGILGSFSEISMHGELLNPAQGHLASRVLPKTLVPCWLSCTLGRVSPSSSCEGGQRWGGCKIFIDEAIDYRLLVACPKEARYVILYRQNVLEQFVSLNLARQRGVWIEFGSTAEQLPSISLDAQELIAFRDHLKRGYERALLQIPRDQVVCIAYEEMLLYKYTVSDWIRSILEPMLGNLTRIDRELAMVKQNNEGLSCVTNLEEILALVKLENLVMTI